MQGQRQNLAATLIAANGVYEFQTDLQKEVKRIKFYPNEAIANPLNEKVLIQAEQELLFSGLSLPICAIAIKSDDGYITVANQVLSPWILVLDRPLLFSKDMPIRFTMTSAEAWYVILEGP